MRLAGSLHRHRQSLIHPGFCTAAGDGCREQVGRPVKPALSTEFGSGDAEACHADRHVASIGTGRTAGRCGIGRRRLRRQVGRDGSPHIAGIDDGRRQADIVEFILDAGGGPCCQGLLRRSRRYGRSCGRRARALRQRRRIRLLAAGHAVASIRNLEHAATHAVASYAARLEATALAAVDAAGPAHAAAGLERIDATACAQRHDEVADRIDLDDEVFGSFVLGRDQHHLILDEVGEVDVAQQESQRRPQRDARHVLRDDCRVEIEPRVLKRFLVGEDRDIVLVLELIDDVPQGSLLEVQLIHRLVEGVIKLLLGTARIGEIDRFILLATLGDVAPAGGVRIVNGRLVHERDCGQIDQVQRVHEISLHLAAIADILRIVMERSGHDGGRPGHLAGHHRHRVVAVNSRSFHRHLVGDLALRADEFVVLARGIIGQLEGVVMLLDEGPLITLLDPRGQERRVAFGQLLESLFLGPQCAVEPLPLTADRSPALVCQVAFHLLA